MINQRIGDEDFLKGLNENDQWRTAFLRLVSDVWENEDESVYDLDIDQVTDLLKNKYDFTPPESLRLKFKKFEGNEKYNTSSPYKVNGWDSVMSEKSNNGTDLAYHTTVEMMIPPKPESKLASAITDFMAEGKSYPFTCM